MTCWRGSTLWTVAPKSPLTTNARNNPTATNPDLWAAAAPVAPATAANFPATVSNSSTPNTTNFIENSISGGAVTAYDSAGSPVSIQLRWAKATNATGDHQWGLYYQSTSGDNPVWTKATEATFSDAGALTTPAAPATSVALTGVTVDGVNLGTLSLNYSARDGITSFADSTGKSNVRQLVQDGVPAGNFTGVSIADGGRVIAQYSNGKTVDIYQIPLVEFSGETSLRPIDGGAYQETKESGPPINNTSGAVVGSALESSNVDIGEEFTKLIVTQQAFSANSRVITTADQMLSDVINIIR